MALGYPRPATIHKLLSQSLGLSVLGTSIRLSVHLFYDNTLRAKARGHVNQLDINNGKLAYRWQRHVYHHNLYF